MGTVELVNVRTADGIRLDGSLALPTAQPRLGLDAVILHHGVGANFYNASFFTRVQQGLLEAGCAVLRVNNRGHDLAYNVPNGRLGAAFEVVDDCRKDWTAWLDFAESLGYRRLGLWGHSLGAVKTIYFLAADQDSRVKNAAAISPPIFSWEHYLAKEGASRFRELFEQAQRLVSDGRPDELFPITIPTRAILAARTYVDKYGPEERYNILRRIPDVRVPLLLTIGGEEGKGPEASDWFPFGGLAAEVDALAARTPNLTFRLIAGANHGYDGKEQQLWDAALEWLQRLGSPAAARP